MATQYVTQLVKRGSADDWAASTVPLQAGEWGYDQTNRVAKIGDGFNLWVDLPTWLQATGEGQLPDIVRSALAANLADPSTPEGAALSELITAGGGVPGSVPAVLVETETPVGPFVSDANTVALYHLENDGSDASGNGFTATPETAYATPTYSNTAARFGQYGMSGPALRVPDAAGAFMTGSPSPAYSVEAWVRTTKEALMVAVGRGAAFYLGQDANGNALAAYQSGGTTRQITSATKINDGVYHHIALAVSGSGGGAKLIVDDAVVASDATAGSNVGTTNPFTIGSMGAAYLWVGEIDEVRISNVARTAGRAKTYPARPSLGPGMVTYVGLATPTDMLKGDAWRKVSA